MKQYECEHCKAVFSDRNERHRHRKTCEMKVYAYGPSFSNKLSTKQAKERRRIAGSYEWAISRSPTKGESKLVEPLVAKGYEYLSKEVMRLEGSIIIRKVHDERTMKRQIVCSKALKIVSERIADKNKQIQDQKKRNQALAGMKEKLKPDLPSSNDLMDRYTRNGNRVVVSGGLPSLGKKR